MVDMIVQQPTRMGTDPSGHLHQHLFETFLTVHEFLGEYEMHSQKPIVLQKREEFPA